jgi:glycosyltransferase involved in cell wall biosynthesis
MKILMISVRSDIGGGPKHLLDLSKSLRNRGLDIFIAAPCCGDFVNDFKANSSGLISIPFRRFSIISFFLLVIFAKKNGITVIHSHGRGAGIYSRPMKLLGFKVIHTFHGVHIVDSHIGKVKLFVDKLLVAFTDAFICVSESEMKNALNNKITSLKKTVVIHNGVDIPNSSPAVANSIFTIGTLSRLNYQKGLDILLKFIEKFENETDSNLKCLVAGGGELKEELTSLNKTKSVSFIGEVIAQPFLDSIDLYISFARWEGLPIAVLEAMSTGKPCLLSNVDGNRDLVIGESAVLFELDNYDDFKDKLTRFLSEKEYLVNIAKTGREVVKKEFSIEKMSKKTVKLYENR